MKLSFCLKNELGKGVAGQMCPQSCSSSTVSAPFLLFNLMAWMAPGLGCVLRLAPEELCCLQMASMGPGLQARDLRLPWRDNPSPGELPLYQASPDAAQS